MKRLLVLLALGPAAVPASAADAKISGVIFAHYEAVTSEFLSNGTKAAGRNEFDVSRVYLNAAAPLDERFSGFLQLEANLSSRDNTSNQVFLKQAYLEMKEVYPGAKLMFGLIGTPWRSFEEGIWKHRFAAKILEDEEGLMYATDRGLRLSGKLPHIAYDAMVANGEGTGARGTTGNETNKYKDYIGKISVSPVAEGTLAGLKLNAQVQKGSRGQDLTRDRLLAGASYEGGRFNLMGTYVGSSDRTAAGGALVKGAGFSIHAVADVAKTCWVFARYDSWDPDLDTSDDAHSRVIAGMGHRLTEGARVALDYQALVQEKEAAARKDQGLASLHLEVKF